VEPAPAPSGGASVRIPDAFSGNQVAFEVDYASGEQGVYVATLGGNRCPLSLGVPVCRR
jgi:hypothetical protein